MVAYHELYAVGNALFLLLCSDLLGLGRFSDFQPGFSTITIEFIHSAG